MKIPKVKIAMLLGLVAIGFVGSASAQTGQYGEYAVSDTVTELNTTSDQIAFNFSNVSSENVYVELISSGEVVHTTSELTLDSTGFADYTADSTYSVDQIAVYPMDSDAESVDSVDLLYDYSGTDTTDATNYASTQTFTGFEVDSGAFAVMETIIPWVMLIAIMGAMLE